MSMTISEVITEFGNYYIDGGQGEKDILQKYYQPSVTHQFFNPVPTKDTKVRGTKSFKNSVLQRYQEQFTPKGGGEFKPWELDLAWMKIDESEVFDELVQSWMGFMAGLDTADKKSWPFVRWYMSEILKQANQDYELNEVYKGVQGVITPGTPTANGASMNGIGKQIADGITDSDIVPINSNPIWSTDPVDFVTEIETWFKEAKATSNENKLIIDNFVDYIFMTTEKMEIYAEGLHQKYNMNYNQSGIGLFDAPAMLPLKHTKIKLVGLPSMGESNRIFMTPKENRIAFDRIPQGRLPLMLETVDRHVKIFGDMHKAAGFKWKGFVFTNQLV